MNKVVIHMTKWDVTFGCNDRGEQHDFRSKLSKAGAWKAHRLGKTEVALGSQTGRHGVCTPGHTYIPPGSTHGAAWCLLTRLRALEVPLDLHATPQSSDLGATIPPKAKLQGKEQLVGGGVLPACPVPAFPGDGCT